METAQATDITRALCEIHNRLGEITMLLQLLVLSKAGNINFTTDDALHKLLEGACTISHDGKYLRTPMAQYTKEYR